MYICTTSSKHYEFFQIRNLPLFHSFIIVGYNEVWLPHDVHNEWRTWAHCRRALQSANCASGKPRRRTTAIYLTVSDVTSVRPTVVSNSLCNPTANSRQTINIKGAAQQQRYSSASFAAITDDHFLWTQHLLDSMSKPNLQNRQTASGIATNIYTVVDSSAKETTDYNCSDC